MSDAILVTRCLACGWTHVTGPTNKTFVEKYIECFNPKCAELGRKYEMPVLPVHPYRNKG